MHILEHCANGTGESIPAEIVESIVAAKNFLAAYGNVRQLSFGDRKSVV